MQKNNWSTRINNNKNTSGLVAQGLMEMIYAFKFKPGERLKQDYIAKIFGVSRATVRDSLYQLMEIGLASRIARKGFIVCPLLEKTIRELYSIRRILESYAIKLVIENIDSKTLTKLEDLVIQQKRLKKTSNIDEIVEKDSEFLQVLYSYNTTKNDNLCNLIHSN